jgi:hypothetical protein
MKTLKFGANFRWFIKFIFIDGWPNIFALIALAYCGYMLDRGHLTPQAQTRFEDFIGMIVGYYFLANAKSFKADNTIQTMADTQKHLATNAAPVEEAIKEGDNVVIKKTHE